MNLTRASLLDDSHADQLIELNEDRGKSEQYTIQMQTERNNLQQLEEQEEAIRTLEVSFLLYERVILTS